MALALTAAVAGWSCGDDEDPPEQAAIWLSFTSAQGATCSSAASLQIPANIAQSIVTGSGKGPEGMPDRVRDSGGDVIDCSLSPGPAPDSYNVSMYYSNPANAVGGLDISGVLTQDQTVPIRLLFTSSAFSLSSDPPGETCMGRVKVLNSRGAVWIDQLSCPSLKDDRSPSIECVVSGGLIFENCN